MPQYTLGDFESTGVESDKVPCPTCGDLYHETGVAAHHWQVHGEELKKEVVCDYCGERLRRKPSEVYDTNFCNDEHMYAYQQGENHHNYNSVKTECVECGHSLERNESHVGEIGAFCDYDCYGKWLSRNRTGQDSAAWRGGISHTDALRKCFSNRSWNKIAEEARDNADRTCEMCGSTSEGKRLDVHHIVPIVSGGSNHQDNLLALCDACHRNCDSFIRQYPEFDPVLVE